MPDHRSHLSLHPKLISSYPTPLCSTSPFGPPHTSSHHPNFTPLHPSFLFPDSQTLLGLIPCSKPSMPVARSRLRRPFLNRDSSFELPVQPMAVPVFLQGRKSEASDSGGSRKWCPAFYPTRARSIFRKDVTALGKISSMSCEGGDWKTGVRETYPRQGVVVI